VPIEDFNLMAGPALMDNAIQAALTSKHRSRSRAGESTRTAAGAGSTRAGRAKVNYATLDHASEPRRGRIIEAEKELVRSHLQEINKRPSDGGPRKIDPNDPTTQEHHGRQLVDVLAVGYR